MELDVLRRMRTPIDDSDIHRTISKQSILEELEMDTMMLSKGAFSPIKTRGFLMSMVNSETNSPDKESFLSPDRKDNFNINILNTNNDEDLD